MVHVGMDLHHRMVYLRAITGDGELLPGKAVDMPQTGDLRTFKKAPKAEKAKKADPQLPLEE